MILTKKFKDTKKLTKYQTLEYDKLQGYSFAGREQETNGLCGQYKSAWSCECKHTRRIHQKSCNQIKCHICYKSACSRRAKNITERLWGINEYLGTYLLHISINPPEEIFDTIFNDPEDYKKNVVYPIIKKISEGGIAIFHAYRIINEKLTWSPHYHCIVACHSKFIPGDLYKKEFDLIIINHPKKDKFGNILSTYLETPEDVSNVAYYQLTHCSFKEGKHAYSYIGNFSYAKFKKVSTTYQTVDCECEECGGKIYSVIPSNMKVAYNNTTLIEIKRCKNIMRSHSRLKDTKYFLASIKKDKLIEEQFILLDFYDYDSIDIDNWLQEELLTCSDYRPTRSLNT